MKPSTDVSADRLYGLLLTKLKEEHTKIAGWPERVNEHVLVVSGHNTLPVFHANGGMETEKAAVYRDCLRAIVTNAPECLLRASENPLKVSQPKVTRDSMAEEQALATINDSPRERTEVAPAEEKHVLGAIPLDSHKCESVASPADKLTAALRELLGKPQEAKLDEEAVKKICQLEWSAKSADLFKHVEEALAKRAPTLTFQLSGKEAVEIDGVTHWQLPQLVTWVAADVPVWVWGQAGGGKTHLGRQIGKALAMPRVVIVSVDPTMTVGKLLGYRNLATGDFVQGFLYQPFKDGGLVMVDEIDTGDPGILASVNALIANGEYLFPNGETVQRHADFRIIAGANTKGTGAVAGYTARNRLDAATLDRFAVIELEYDEDMETSLAVCKPKVGAPSKSWKSGTSADVRSVLKWVEYVQAVRSKVGQSVLVSPRVSILGARALRAGVPASEVAEALLFKLVTSDTRRSIISQCGEFSL